MSFLSKLCNDYESRVQDSADVTVGSLSDADLREAVRSALGDTYRLVNIVRHDGDIELQLESERDGMVYQYSYFEPGHVLVDDFKRELSATKLRPVSSYKKKVGDSKVRRRAQDSEGDFYSKKVWGADDSDIARVVRESNPILEHIGWGTNAKRSVDFRMMGDDEVAYVEIPVVAGMTLGDLRDALDPNNLPFPGIVDDSKGCGRAQDSEDAWPYRNTEDPEEARLELEKLFDAYVPASGMADTLGGELLRAYVRLLYRCENDGDIPFEGYGNITCNSSWRFLANYFVNVLGRRDGLNLSSDWKEWNRTLIDFAPELLSVLNAGDGALFRKPNNVDSREATEEDYEAERAEWDEDDEIDDDYIYDSAGHHCKKCDAGKLSENRRRMRRDSWLEKQGAKVSDAVDTNWGKTNEDDKNYYVKNENDKDEIFDAAVLLFFTKGLKNEIYWRDVNAEYEYGDEYYGLINYICKCLRIKNDDNVDIVKQAYRGIDALADLFNYDFGRLQKFAENNKKINYSDFYKDMHYLYANKAYDVLLNTFGDIEVVSDSAGHHCKKCDEGKVAVNCRRMSDSEDLDGWERVYSGSLREPAYVKEYGDNIPNMKIVDFTKFGGPAEFRIHTPLLKRLGFDELADILYFTKFDSFSEAAGVADRIAAAYSRFYKSLSDIIE